MSDLKSHRVSWVIGYTYVGDGASGTANNVYFLTASNTYLIKGFVANSSGGMVPISGSDVDLGATYVSDVEKHYARKVIRRMWINVDSLQPNTSNNMMCVIAISRGPGGTDMSIPITKATAAVTSNTVANVSSMNKAFTVDSWEHRTVEISEFIAGGSGPRQNEFDIQGSPAGASQGIYGNGSGAEPSIDGVGNIPACLAVAGNSTTVALQATNVHQISITQEIDLLDFVGGMAQTRSE